MLAEKSPNSNGSVAALITCFLWYCEQLLLFLILMCVTVSTVWSFVFV